MLSTCEVDQSMRCRARGNKLGMRARSSLEAWQDYAHGECRCERMAVALSDPLLAGPNVDKVSGERRAGKDSNAQSLEVGMMSEALYALWVTGNNNISLGQ